MLDRIPRDDPIKVEATCASLSLSLHFPFSPLSTLTKLGIHTIRDSVLQAPLFLDGEPSSSFFYTLSLVVVPRLWPPELAIALRSSGRIHPNRSLR
jgi:hypothetical protein